MTLLEFRLYIGQSLNFAATPQRQVVYTSPESKAEDMTPRPTKKSVQIPTRMQEEVAAVSSHCVQSIVKPNYEMTKYELQQKENFQMHCM
jgi:hypothetical protein